MNREKEIVMLSYKNISHNFYGFAFVFFSFFYNFNFKT